MGKTSGIDGLWEIDEAQLAILVAWLVDDGNSIACTGIHGIGIPIVLVGDIEGTPVSADPGDKGHVPGCAKGPRAVGHGEDRYRANPWRCAQWQTCAFGVDDPIGSIAPVERQVIAEQVPLLPGLPDTVSSAWIGAGAQLEGVAVGRVKSLIT